MKTTHLSEMFKNLPATLFLGFLFLFSAAGAQESTKKKSYLFNEFHASVNHTTLPKSSIDNQFGCGLGIKRKLFSDKKVNLICGFEYNVSRLQISYIYNGHSSYQTDVRIAMHNFSVPLCARIPISKQGRFFVEAGGFVDFPIKTIGRGILHTDVKDANNNVVHQTKAFKDGDFALRLNYGYTLGAGARIPLNTHEVLIWVDHKFGLSAPDGSFFNWYARLHVGFSI